MYTQARVCAVSPGGPVNTLLIDPIFYDQATQGGGAGLVGSVSNSDGTLTITPTTGVVIASIALGHPNTWTSTQTFSTSPLVPTAAPGTNNTQAASTAFVQAATAVFLNNLCTTAGAFPVYNAVSAAWVCSTVGGTGSQAVLAGPLTINPQSGVIPGFTINQSLSGSSLPTGNAANLIFITGDTAQAGAGFINGSEITHFVGGSAVTGGREAFASFLKLTAPTNASNPNRNYAGIWGNAFSDAGDGGTNTGAGALGALFGSGAWGDLQSGATNLLNVSAAEYNVSARTGASVKHKTIIQAVQHALDAVPGATTDAAIVVSSQGSPATGLTDGLLFSDMAGAQGVKTAGSLIRSTGGTFANGVDFSASTLTTAYKSSGFNVDGSGNVTMNNRAVAGDIWAGTSNKFLDAASAQAALAPQAITISGSTYTPVIANGINYEVTLVHASCPCTIANIASPPVGQSFYLTVIQSATGSDTIGTWGTNYKFPGGTHPTLSAGANAVDILPVYCRTATFCAVVFAGNFQ
jgi:hypothetical protein